MFGIDGELFRDRADGSFERLDVPGSLHVWHDERGLVYHAGGQLHRYRDFETDADRDVSIADAWPRLRFDGDLLVSGRKTGIDSIRILDADGSLRPVPGLSDHERIVGKTSTGDALLLVKTDADGSKQTCRVELMSRNTRERRSVRFDDSEPVLVEWLATRNVFGGEDWSGPLIVRGEATHHAGSPRIFLAKLDEAGATLVTTHAAVGFPFSLVEDDCAIALQEDGRALVRVRFGSDEAEVVFPRPPRNP